ncbi:S8 family serine peptidase [Aeromonas jandaei]|uniref:S8 family serine peptidase n=1 Tax=Aeromonas jandaei TaxID=650 RepID=UPI002AA0C62A|nr:S8 family serine peptidase [Aeromonas jandaei]
MKMLFRSIVSVAIATVLFGCNDNAASNKNPENGNAKATVCSSLPAKIGDMDVSRDSPQRCLPNNGNPLVPYQWHLLNTGQDAFSASSGIAGFDLNLWWAHRAGILGQGINVAVIDDAVELEHPDLSDNIRDGSWNFLNDSSNVAVSDKSSSHGTSVAGIIAAVDNAVGVKGVAPKAKLQSYPYVVAQTASESASLLAFLFSHGGSKRSEGNRLFNMSYGDDLISPDVLDTVQEVKDELQKRITLKNKAIYVKSAGNEYSEMSMPNGKGERISKIIDKAAGYDLTWLNPNTSADNSNYWNMLVGGINAKGVRAPYSSVGSALFISAPSGDSGIESPAIVTTDLTGCDAGYNQSSMAGEKPQNRLHGGTAIDVKCDYTSTMDGTSAAAPSVTGSIALIMSAYPDLASRDIRYLLAKSATLIDKDSPSQIIKYQKAGEIKSFEAVESWEKNAAGLWFNQAYGFGLVDVNKALELAANHTPLPPLQVSEWYDTNLPDPLPISDGESTESSFNAIDNKFAIVDAVMVTVNIEHERFSDLLIELISPSGTKSVLMTPHSALMVGYKESQSVKNFRMLSNKFMGEKVTGNWLLRVTDVSNDEVKYHSVNPVDSVKKEHAVPNNSKDGVLKDWSIQFVGGAEV